MKDDFSYPRHRFESALGLLEKEEISEKNKDAIRLFIKTKLAMGTSKLRAIKLLYGMRFLARWLEKDFEDATKEDLIDLVGDLETKDYSEHSKYDFKIILKQFYKWMKGNDEEFPPEISWLKPRMKNNKHKLPEELLTVEDVEKLAEAANNSRDKAFILVLYESGCRIGELLPLRLKHIKFDNHGVIFRVTGKTGDRRVRIIASSHALTQWLQDHPAQNDPEAALWPPKERRYGLAPCGLQSIHSMLKDTAKRAGIKKRIYPHLFRHSRATFLASRLTDAQMKEFFGWTQSSKMASVYIHLSGRDVDKALLKLYGIEPDEESEKELFMPKACPRCKQENSPSNKYCSRCGSPLDLETALQSEEKHVEADKVMNQLICDPEVKQLLLEKMRALIL